MNVWNGILLKCIWELWRYWSPFSYCNQIWRVLEKLEANHQGYYIHFWHHYTSYIHDLNSFSFQDFCYALILVREWCGQTCETPESPSVRVRPAFWIRHAKHVRRFSSPSALWGRREGGSGICIGSRVPPVMWWWRKICAISNHNTCTVGPSRRALVKITE